MLVNENKIDKRITLMLKSDSQFERALQWDPKENTFDWVTVYDIDGGFRINTIVADDANLVSQGKESYRIFRNNVKVGDLVEIVKGRKMKGDIKLVSETFTYKVNYYTTVDYLVFEDGTKVQQKNCKILKGENTCITK